MRELYFGGFVAPNMYYVGSAGVVNLVAPGARKLLRIFGISGIFKPYNFYSKHATLPLNTDTIRTCYHVNQVETLRASLLEGGGKVDIGLSHDWPRGAHKHGDLAELIKTKPFFEDDIKTGKFGNPVSSFLLKSLGPERWFSGHCHVNFDAEYDNDAKT